VLVLCLGCVCCNCGYRCGAVVAGVGVVSWLCVL
jgi:hypothetical protein